MMDGGGTGTSRLPVFIHPSEFVFYVSERGSHKQILTIYNPYDFSIRFKIRSTNPKKYSVNEAEGSIEPRGIIDIAIRHLEVTLENVNSRDKFRVQLYENGHYYSTTSSRNNNNNNQIGQKEFSSVVLEHSPAHLKQQQQQQSRNNNNNSLLQPVPREESVYSAAFDASQSKSTSVNGGAGDRIQALLNSTTNNNNSNNAQMGKPWSSSSSSGNNSNSSSSNTTSNSSQKTPNIWCVVLALLCLCAILMPLDRSEDALQCGGGEGAESSSSSVFVPSSLVPSFLLFSLNQKLIASFTLGLITMAMLQNA